jgi:hypothetical protein
MYTVTGLLLQFVKNERRRKKLLWKLNLTVYLLEIYIFGPFLEGLSWEIKTGSIMN